VSKLLEYRMDRELGHQVSLYQIVGQNQTFTFVTIPE